VLWPAVETACFDVKTKFTCNDDLVANGRERFPDELLARIWAVDFGCIEERDALFMGCAIQLPFPSSNASEVERPRNASICAFRPATFCSAVPMASAPAMSGAAVALGSQR